MIADNPKSFVQVSESCTFVPKPASCGQVIISFRRSQTIPSRLYREKGFRKHIVIFDYARKIMAEKRTIIQENMQADNAESQTGQKC